MLHISSFLSCYFKSHLMHTSSLSCCSSTVLSSTPVALYLSGCVSEYVNSCSLTYVFFPLINLLFCSIKESVLEQPTMLVGGKLRE